MSILCFNLDIEFPSFFGMIKTNLKILLLPGAREMNDIEIRKAILQKLYAVDRATGSCGSHGYDEFAKELGVDKETLLFNFSYLREKNYVKRATTSSCCICTKGIDFIEGASEFNPKQQYLQQTIEVTGGSVGQINQAHTINNPSYLLDRLTEAVEKAQGIEQPRKKSWLKSLREMSKHPVLLEVIKKVLSVGFD